MRGKDSYVFHILHRPIYRSDGSALVCGIFSGAVKIRQHASQSRQQHNPSRGPNGTSRRSRSRPACGRRRHCRSAAVEACRCRRCRQPPGQRAAPSWLGPVREASANGLRASSQWAEGCAPGQNGCASRGRHGLRRRVKCDERGEWLSMRTVIAVLNG